MGCGRTVESILGGAPGASVTAERPGFDRDHWDIGVLHSLVLAAALNTTLDMAARSHQGRDGPARSLSDTPASSPQQRRRSTGCMPKR